MLATQDPVIEKAVGRLKELSQDEALRMLAESRQMAQWDDASRMRGARKEGLKEGEKRGEKRGEKKALLLVARNLLDAGQPVDTILKVTGLSREAISSLMH